jgi:hypothetical protein
MAHLNREVGHRRVGGLETQSPASGFVLFARM